jgi:uroporphyrinogen-III synthase
MQQIKRTILSTRPLDASLINIAKQQGINIDIISFIETEAIQTTVVQETIKNVLQQTATVVFTSTNAVETVAKELSTRPTTWNIYCVGTTTAMLAKKYFGEPAVITTANNAAELATSIVDEKVISKVTFFCGDRRRDELPGILLDNNIEVNEIIVYRTIESPHTIEKRYHGILYFSPSAVESFFANNKLSNDTLLFAIGNTTADEITKHSTNKIIISDEPGKESLIRKMIDYFSKE